MMMQFDWTINLGTILTIVTLILTAYSVVQAVNNRLQLFEASLKTHGDLLKKHDLLFGTYEARVFQLVSDLQRLIGQFETMKHTYTQGQQ